MARRKKGSRSCGVRTISFKTKRGRRISFDGRPTGYGSPCKPAPKRATSAQRAVRKAFRAAAKACKGKSRAKRNSCVKSKFRAAY